MAPIKLISLNVAVFEQNNKKLSKFFKEQKPDIICLQEVSKKIDSTTLKNYVSIGAINNSTNQLCYSFFSPNVVIQDFQMPDFHGKKNFNIHFKGFIEIGLYLKSRYKIIKGQGIFIQSNFSYITEWTNWPEGDPKALQVVDLKLDDTKKIRIINYHGIWSRDKKGTEITEKAGNKIFKLASEISYPSIICGDFNLFPETKSMKILNNNFISLVDKYKIKTTRPVSNELSHHKRNVVDYVFVSPAIKIKDFQVVNSKVSDHLPLILTFSV